MQEAAESGTENFSDKNFSHDAFISYSHAADGQLAPSLQQALQRLAKPWYRTRALRVFRDKTSLSAAPALWPSIEKSLQRCRYFLLLASPEAAQSKWVQQEVQWWLEHRSPETLLIVLTNGDLVWDEKVGDFSWPVTDALPVLLSGRFSDEPLYVDLRWAKGSTQLSLSHSEFRSAVLDLAAPIHGRPKEDIDSEEVRQHRRTRRLAVSIGVILVVLTVASLIGGYIATQQRDLAEQRGQIALARQLAAQAQSQMDMTSAGLERSLLLATASLQASDTLEGRIAWQRAIKLFPSRSLSYASPESNMGIDVAHVSDSTRIVVAGWLGKPCVWEPPNPEPVRCFEHRAKSGNAYLSADGNMLISDAEDNGTSTLWDVGSGDIKLQVTHGTNQARHFLNSNDSLLVGISLYTQGAWLLDVPSKRLIARVHENETVRHAVFNPAGNLLATLGGKLRIWRTSDGKELPAPQIADDDPHAQEHISFIPGTNLLIAGHEVFDVENGQRVTYLKHDEISAIAVSPDGHWIATGGNYRDAQVRIWEVGSWRLAQTLPQSGGITELAFSPDSNQLASASYEPVSEKHADVRIWNIGTRFAEAGRMAMPSQVKHLQYSSDSNHLVASSEDGTVQAWRLNSSAARLISPPGSACALSHNGTSAVVVSPSNEVRVLRLPDLAETQRLRHDHPIAHLAMSGNGQRLATVTRTVDEARETQRRKDEEHARQVFQLPPEMYANKEPRYFQRTLHIWDLSTGTTINTQPHPGEIYSIAVSHSGGLVATADADGGHEVYSFTVGSKSMPLKLPHPSDVVAMEFHPTSDRLITGNGGRFSIRGNSTATVWDAAIGAQILQIQHSGSVVGIAISSDGRLAASADMDNTIAIWNPDTGEELHRLADTASAVLFSPDAALLASASGATVVQTWNVASGQSVARVGHGDEAYARIDASLAFSPDGAWLATARPDSTVRVWNTAGLQEKARLEFFGSEIWVDDIRVLPAEGVIAVCGNLGTFDRETPSLNRTVEIWDWRTSDMIDRACARLTRDLTENEWIRFMGNAPYRPICTEPN